MQESSSLKFYNSWLMKYYRKANFLSELAKLDCYSTHGLYTLQTQNLPI